MWFSWFLILWIPVNRHTHIRHMTLWHYTRFKRESLWTDQLQTLTDSMACVADGGANYTKFAHIYCAVLCLSRSKVWTLNLRSKHLCFDPVAFLTNLFQSNWLYISTKTCASLLLLVLEIRCSPCLACICQPVSKLDERLNQLHFDLALFRASLLLKEQIFGCSSVC